MNKYRISKNKGMTLIEVIIYVILLSVLMATFIQYVYAIEEQNHRLMYEIQDTYE